MERHVELALSDLVYEIHRYDPQVLTLKIFPVLGIAKRGRSGITHRFRSVALP